MKSLLPGGTESTCIVASPVIRRDQPDGEVSCVMLESGLTRSLNCCQASAMFVACSMRGLCCTANEAADGCAKLCCRMLWCLNHIRMIMAMYVSSVDLCTFTSLHKSFAWWAVTQRASKNNNIKLSNWGMSAWVGMGACLGILLNQLMHLTWTCRHVYSVTDPSHKEYIYPIIQQVAHDDIEY